MNEKRYKELNEYLNEIFKHCEEENFFFLRNIEELAKMNDIFLQYIMDKQIEDKTIENKLTFEDILTITREIIASIDKNYLKDFDTLMASGILDFSFEQEYRDSCFTHIESRGQIYNLVDINREFNYDDVLSFVHEFIHFTNGKEKIGANWNALTEFLSIYFEIYAAEYLFNKGIPNDEIHLMDRLTIAKQHAITLSRYEIVLLAYEKFGPLNKDTYQILSKTILNISEQQFELECYNLYKNLRKIDREESSEKKKTQSRASKLSDAFITRNYRYVFGTLLAFYAKSYVNREDIVYLNNHINEMDEKSVTEICHSIGINIGFSSEIEEMDLQMEVALQKRNTEFLMKTFASMDDYLGKYNNNIKR
jgi:hypothetical protein